MNAELSKGAGKKGGSRISMYVGGGAADKRMSVYGGKPGSEPSGVRSSTLNRAHPMTQTLRTQAPDTVARAGAPRGIQGGVVSPMRIDKSLIT